VVWLHPPRFHPGFAFLIQSAAETFLKLLPLQVPALASTISVAGAAKATAAAPSHTRDVTPSMMSDFCARSVRSFESRRLEEDYIYEIEECRLTERTVWDQHPVVSPPFNVRTLCAIYLVVVLAFFGKRVVTCEQGYLIRPLPVVKTSFAGMSASEDRVRKAPSEGSSLDH